MRIHLASLALAAAIVLPVFTRAQHSHGSSGMDLPPRRERHEHSSPPATPRGLLPPGSPRQIEVLVMSHGFSPTEIPAEQGEEIVLLVRRSDESHCAGGLEIPVKRLVMELPLGETVPVTLKLDAEAIVLQCANEDMRASIVVAPR